MKPSCPQCNQQLPEVEMVEYRFCPHCGAEIAAEPRQQPKLKPPDTPPPASFFRNRSVEKTLSIRSEEKAPPKKDIKKEPPTKTRNIIIATLVILAIIILLLGGLFTF